jgi:hypothetical protein
MREDMMRMPFLSNDKSGAALASVTRDKGDVANESQATSSHLGAVAVDSPAAKVVISPRLVNVSWYHNNLGIAYADLGPPTGDDYRHELGLDVNKLACGFEQFGVHEDSCDSFLTEKECHDKQLADRRLPPTDNR